MKDLDFGELLIGVIIGLIVLFIILGFLFDVYVYFHCWGLPLNEDLPFECFNKGFYSVINNN